jgi:predicted phage terminase large subunit-like protein
MTNEQAPIDAALRNDFLSFVEKVFYTVDPGRVFIPNWHNELIADLAEQCRRGKINRLLVNLPPRSLKTIMLTIALPAFILGHDPTARIICVSYAQDLAEDHSLRFRLVVNSTWYRRLFPRMRLSSMKNTAVESTTTAGGFRLATSIGGTLTGRGGDWIIIDDPLKSSEAHSESTREYVNRWLDETCYSRLDSKAKGVIIVVMQRLHVADLAGHLLAKASHWHHAALPAIAETDESFELSDGRRFERHVGEALNPAWESLEELRKTEQIVGSLTFSAQFQQAPVPIEGGMIKLDWLRNYATAPTQQPGDILVHSWDTASKANKYNDFSVCTVWLTKGPDHYLLSVHRRRLEYPHLKKWIIDLAHRDRPDQILIEDQSSGTQLLQELRAESDLRPVGILPKTDKLTRAVVQSGKIEAGRVYVPSQAHWLEPFRCEVAAFPNGTFDDQIDSMTQYLAWVSDRKMVDAPVILVESRVATEWDAEFGYNGRYW